MFETNPRRLLRISPRNQLLFYFFHFTFMAPSMCNRAMDMYWGFSVQILKM